MYIYIYIYIYIGGKVYVGDLDQENYRFLHTDNTVVCQVKTARTAIAEDDDEDELEEGEAEATEAAPAAESQE